MLCLYFIWNKSILVFANYPKGCKCSFTFECIPPVMFGVQLHHSERHWSLASLTNNEGGGGVEALCQGSIGTHLLTLVHLYLSSYSLNTITHSVCATDGCTSGTCKLTITHTHRAWTCGICVMDQWPLAPLRHPWMFACFPSNKMRLKGGVCNCSWDNVKTNTAHWYRAMLQEDVRGHNGGKQSVGQVVAGLLGDNGKGLIS